MPKTNAAWIIATALALAAALPPAHAKLVATPTPAPTDEALSKVEGWIKDHPTDAAGYYTLGRVHALAWGYGDKIPLIWYDKSKLPQFGDYSTIRITRQGLTEPVVDGHGGLDSLTAHPAVAALTAADLTHLQASIDAYTKATVLDPANGLYEEGLAWMLQRKGEAGAAMAQEAKDLTPAEKTKFAQATGQLGAPDFAARESARKILMDAMPRCAATLKAVQSDDPEVTARIAGIFQDYWDLQALPHYRIAYSLTIKTDQQNPNTGATDGLVSADAAKQMQAILAAHPTAAKPGEKEDLKKYLEGLPDGSALPMFYYKL